MNTPRTSHSSCCLGNKLYIAGGYDRSYNGLLSIECLDLNHLLVGLFVRWRNIPISKTQDIPRNNEPVMVPINENEIALLGGHFEEILPI